MQSFSIARCSFCRVVKHHHGAWHFCENLYAKKYHIGASVQQEHTPDSTNQSNTQIKRKETNNAAQSQCKETKLSILNESGLPDPPTNCCMSGCANCVWIEYAEQLAQYYKDSGEAARSMLKNIEDPNMRAFLQMELQIKL